MGTTMKIEMIQKQVNDEILLRKPDPKLIAAYAEKMSAGATFPPIIIGTWPLSEKYGSTGIVDGMNRLGAATVAGLKSFPVEERKYTTLSDMLADMYVLNIAHGQPVSEGQRNARIKLLRSQGMTLETIAKMFNLGKSSIDRIAKNDQGEGKPGRKGGANASKGQGTQAPLKAKAFFTMLERLNKELTRKRPDVKAEILAYMSPCTDENEDGELDEDLFKSLKSVHAHFGEMIKMFA